VKRFRPLWLLVLAAFALFALVSCSGDEEPESSPTPTPTPTATTTATADATTAATTEATVTEEALSGTIVVSAASSLTDAFTEIAAAFQDANPDTQIDLNFGSSSELASQIVEGAPAEVFASANDAQMAVVVDAGLASDPQTFARNRIVVAAPADNDLVQAFEDLAEPGVRLVLAGEEVPVGDYARQAFANADAATPGFSEAVLANLVSEEANVRAVLTKVELGEADAGVVYGTDAAISGDAVRVVDIPEDLAPPASYPIAVVGDEPSDVAQAFVAFVLSEDGQAILASFGFSAP